MPEKFSKEHVKYKNGHNIFILLLLPPRYGLFFISLYKYVNHYY